ncbi:MAG: glycosyltransferase, partial [Proteobacteria bacterium]|nr:glycosyltransferase [Pseudomonadota bacterium]
DIIGILNSDDLYAEKDVIKSVVNVFSDKNVDSVYGNLVYVNRHDLNKVVRFWKSKHFNKKLFYFGWHPPHPTFFVKRDIYKKFGIFRKDLEISADYELMLRFLLKNNISTSYIDKILVKMRIGGKSNKELKKIIQSNKECLKSWRLNGFTIPYYIFFLKPFSKIFQYRF